jgi:hypothetical protein
MKTRTIAELKTRLNKLLTRLLLNLFINNTFSLQESTKLRGDLVIIVKDEVPFYLALKLLKEFDEELDTLRITKVKDDYYKVEMDGDFIKVEKIIKVTDLPIYNGLSTSIEY